MLTVVFLLSCLLRVVQVKFAGIDLQFMLTAGDEELSVAYPNLHGPIYWGARFLFWVVPMAILTILLLYRPWLRSMFPNVSVNRGQLRKNLLLAFSSFVLCLLLAEVVLRSVGMKPGRIQDVEGFEPVDSLYEIRGTVNDANGILKVDTAVSNALPQLFGHITRMSDFHAKDFEEQNIRATLAFARLQAFIEDESLSTPLREEVNRIKRSGPTSCHDSVLMHFWNDPINKDGFYSIPFNASCPGRKKVMLLGDSFTWGHALLELSGSFANTLLAKGHLVYNTGISGTDVAQYKKVLETYLDSIRPDVVIVNFYMGNDVSYFERTPKQKAPVLFRTNAGNLYSFREGHQFGSVQEAYLHVLEQTSVPRTSVANRFMASTVVGTLVYRMLLRLGLTDFPRDVGKERPSVPYCNVQVEEMRQLCAERGVRFILSVIPSIENGTVEGAQTVDHLFEGQEYHEPPVTLDMYKKGDDHFNEEGHLFYADFLDGLLKAEPTTQDP